MIKNQPSTESPEQSPARVRRAGPWRLLCPLLALAAVLLPGVSTAAASPSPFFGLDVASSNFDSASDWKAIENSGARRAHIQFNWGLVNEKGGWANSYDSYVRKAVEHKQEILPYLFGRADGTSAYYEQSEWGPYLNEFVTEAVRRYGYNGSFWAANPDLERKPITTWEVWNEPNFNTNSPNNKASGEKYAKFLKAVSEKIQSVQNSIEPNAHTTRVLFGSLYEAYDRGIPWETFLQEAKNSGLGISAYFNGLGIHPYGFGTAASPATTESARLGSLQNEVQKARTALTNLCTACSEKGLWITEFGWGTTQQPNVAKTVSPEEQSNLLWSSYSWITGAASSLNIQYAAWFIYRDLPDGTWTGSAGLREWGGGFRPSWCTYAAVTAVGSCVTEEKALPPGTEPEDLGFIRLNHPLGKDEIVTYGDRPKYETQSAYSIGDYPSVSDPENVQTLAIDTNGDGVDELGFVRLNHSSGQMELVAYNNAPYFNTQAVYTLTGYPTASDPQNIRVLALDTNGDGKDELGFIRLNHSSGKAELVIYGDAPTYKVQSVYSLTGYPAVSDPQNIKVVALDTNGDGKDELAFLRMNHSSGKVEMVLYGDAPYYKTQSNYSLTGYPAVSDPENVQVVAVDTNGDGVDELGFVRFNHSSGKAELSLYGDAPNYKTQSSYSLTGYPTTATEPKYLRVIAYRNPHPYPATPKMWHYDNLGGVNSSDPDVTSMYSGHLDMFARGSDGALWHRYFSSGSWHNWESLGGSLPAGASPGAESWANGRMDVVARAANNTVTHWWYDGTWHSGDNLGGNITGDPDIASMHSGHLDVFARGTDGGLWHSYYSGGVWSGWTSLGGSLAAGSGVGAVSWGDGRIDVVGRSPSNTVTHWWYNGTWNSGEDLGGTISGTPEISSRAPGVLDVFANNTEGKLIHKWYVNGWSNWETLGGNMASGSGPGAVSWEDGHIDVFGRGTDSTINHWWWG